jgi:uncharacterized protein with HEPN domain
MEKRNRDPLLFLEDIRDAIERIEVHTILGKEEFFDNLTIQDAVLFRLQTIGEAANQLPEEIKVKCPDIPWKKIIGFRHVTAHTYWRIDMNTVWVIIESGELAILKIAVQKLIDELTASS